MKLVRCLLVLRLLLFVVFGWLVAGGSTAVAQLVVGDTNALYCVVAAQDAAGQFRTGPVVQAGDVLFLKVFCPTGRVDFYVPQEPGLWIKVQAQVRSGGQRVKWSATGELYQGALNPGGMLGTRKILRRSAEGSFQAKEDLGGALKVFKVEDLFAVEPGQVYEVTLHVTVLLKDQRELLVRRESDPLFERITFPPCRFEVER